MNDQWKEILWCSGQDVVRDSGWIASQGCIGSLVGKADARRAVVAVSDGWGGTLTAEGYTAIVGVMSRDLGEWRRVDRDRAITADVGAVGGHDRKRSALAVRAPGRFRKALGCKTV